MKLTEKQNNCPYCHGKPLMYYDYGDDSNKIWIDSNGKLQQVTWSATYIAVDTDPEDGVQLNYCPMCGRPLNEEEDDG